jgi:putative transposase
MPRAPRAFSPETALHVVNRGNDRRRLFTTDCEYAAFLVLIRRVARDYPLHLLAYVLMPNHWHLVVWPEEPQGVPRFLQRLTGAHAARLRRESRTVGEGHVYQGRYFAVQLESEIQLLRTLRYVEANPVRARLVEPPNSGVGPA